MDPDDRSDPSHRPGPPRSAASRWLPVTLGAALATVLVIGGTAWLGGRDDDGTSVSGPTRPDPSSPSDGPSDGRTDEASPDDSVATTAPVDAVQVPVFYAGDTAQGLRLFQEQRVVEDTGRSKAQLAVDEALTRAPGDPNYSRWAVAGLKADVEVGADVITIDLRGYGDAGQGDLTGDASRVYVQALVWTADTATGSDLPVRFLADGRAVDEVLGVDTSSPLRRADAETVLSAVSLTTPAQGARLPTTFQVTGQASANEGTVVWELRRGRTVVRSGSATTSRAMEQSPYSFEVTATPGDYTLAVRDTDDSDGEGVGTTEDTRDVKVRTGF